MLFFEMCTFASYVFVSKNRAKGHGIFTFLVMESHEKSWNLKCQKEYEPCMMARDGEIIQRQHFLSSRRHNLPSKVRLRNDQTPRNVYMWMQQ